MRYIYFILLFLTFVPLSFISISKASEDELSFQQKEMLGFLLTLTPEERRELDECMANELFGAMTRQEKAYKEFFINQHAQQIQPKISKELEKQAQKARRELEVIAEEDSQEPKPPASPTLKQPQE